MAKQEMGNGGELLEADSSRNGFRVPEASIVVPTWNRSESLRRCLESLVLIDFPVDRFEIVVADDGSDDSTDIVASDFQRSSGPPVVYVNHGHGGVNWARNAGLSEAKGEVVFFIDDDETVPADYLQHALGILAEDPGLDGVGGPAVGHPAQRHRTCGECSLGSVSLKAGSDGRVLALLGGNMGIRAQVFETVGPFDDRLSGRGDDSEWFSRQSLELLYDDTLFVWHHKDQSTFSLIRDQFRQGRALPLSQKVRGIPFRAQPVLIARAIAHSVVKRCVNGLVVAARESGAITETARLRIVGRIRR